jgi:hypothetical protein
MSEREISEMSQRVAGKIIDAAQADIAELQEQLHTSSKRIEKNIIYCKIENRRSIINHLNKLKFS